MAEIGADGIATSELCENPFTLADSQPFTTVVGNEAIEKATPVDSTFGEHYVSFILTEHGSGIFEQHTSDNQGEQMAIVLNGQVLSAPTINAVLSTEGQISGNFTEAEAYALAIQLNSVLLTTPLEVVEFNSEGIKLPW